MLPVCQLGGKAVYIPFHDTWMHELQADTSEVKNCFKEVGSVNELLPLLS